MSVEIPDPFSLITVWSSIDEDLTKMEIFRFPDTDPYDAAPPPAPPPAPLAAGADGVGWCPLVAADRRQQITCR